MKRTKKTLFALALLASISTAMLSCGGDGTNDAVTTAPATDGSEAVTEAVTATTNLSLLSEKIGAVDMGGAEFRVFSISPGMHFYNKVGADENELFYESETGDILHDAIYRRNRAAEELLNMKLTPIWGEEGTDVSTKTTQNIQAGDDFADAVLNRLDFNMNLAAQHMFYNLYDIPTVDLTAPWWDKTIVSNFTMFGNQLYALCGDIVFYDDYAVAALFGNKKIMSELDMEIPYDMVREGTWTFDKMKEMALAAESDLNGDGKFVREDDRMGYLDHTGAVVHLIYSFGHRMTTTNADGTISVNYDSESFLSAIDRIMDFVATGQGMIGDGCMEIFKSDRALFFYEMIGGISAMRDMESDYCVLPMPKGDESMESYQAFVSNGWTTSYAIPVTVADPDNVGTVLEVMSAASRDEITPALYDVMLEEKFIRDEESKEMLSYIWASKQYDLAVDLSWGADMSNMYYSMASSGKNNFVSTMEKRIKGINKKLDTFLEAFAE